MTGLWNNLFGGGPEKLFEKAESLAREECWAEAIATLEQAKSKLPENDRAGLDEVDRLIERYVADYKEHLAEGIATLAADGDEEAAGDLLAVALSFAADENEKKKFESLLAVRDESAPVPSRKEAVADNRAVSIIRGLADSYSEPLEPKEKEAIFARPELFLRGFVLWNEGRFNEAAALLLAFLEESPHDPYGLLFLGLARAGGGAREEGARTLEEAVHYEPSLVLASLSLGIILKDLGRAMQSASVLEKLCAIVVRYPDQFGTRRREEVIFHTVDTLLAAKEVARAGEMYRAVTQNELFPAHLPLEARLAEGEGNNDAAGELWDAFLKPAAGGGGAIMGHGGQSRGPTPFDFEKGADFFRDRNDQKKAIYYYQRGALNLTHQANAHGEAVSLGDLLRIRKKLAFGLISLGKTEEAERIAEEMEQIQPPPPEAAEIRGRLGE